MYVLIILLMQSVNDAQSLNTTCLFLSSFCLAVCIYVGIVIADVGSDFGPASPVIVKVLFTSK